jgi:acetolactate synthase regulatory subunit
MADRMIVDFAPAEGAVLRLLGLVERRGFRVRAIDMSEQPCGKRASLTLDIVAHDSGRSVDVLELQLHRLHGVFGVTPAPFARGKAA